MGCALPAHCLSLHPRGAGGGGFYHQAGDVIALRDAPPEIAPIVDGFGHNLHLLALAIGGIARVVGERAKNPAASAADVAGPDGFIIPMSGAMVQVEFQHEVAGRGIACVQRGPELGERGAGLLLGLFQTGVVLVKRHPCAAGKQAVGDKHDYERDGAA